MAISAPFASFSPAQPFPETALYVADRVPTVSGAGWKGVVIDAQFDGPLNTAGLPVGVASTSTEYSALGPIPLVIVTLAVPGSVNVGPAVQPVEPVSVAGHAPAM